MISAHERKKAAQKLFKLPPGKLEQVDLSVCRFIPDGMTRAYRNNRYTVMVYDNHITTHGPATRVMIQKHDDQPIMFHWREMQKIKNEVFGPETVAIEYYPAESKLINDHNIYWMWIYPPGILPIPVM